jgi:DNA-binding MarR family transcriptional regulator
METAKLFTDVLREWAEVFMRRSMHDFIQFSKDSGLSMSQLSVLFRLYHGGDCGVSGLGDHLGVTNAAASQMVDRLVHFGILERTEDPDDRRVKKLSLTARGESIVCESIEARRRWLEELTTKLTPAEQESITQALDTLTQAARLLESHRVISEPSFRSDLTFHSE